MREGIIINSVSFNRKLAKFAALSSKSLREATEEGARRFIQNAIRNTRPLVYTMAPGKARKAWYVRVESYLASHRRVKLGKHKSYYRRDEDIKKLMKRKDKKVGRAAAGWMAAAVALNAKRVPAFVRRHGTKEGSCKIRRAHNKMSISFVHSIPYNETENFSCAMFALKITEQGFDKNIRALKRKITRAVK